MADRFPIFKGAIYNTTVAVNTNFFGSDLSPNSTPTTFLIYYAGTNAGGGYAGYPYLVRTNGSNTVTENIGANVPQWGLSTPAIFTVIVGPGDTINMKMPTGTGSAGIVTLIIVEVETASGSPFLRMF